MNTIEENHEKLNLTKYDLEVDVDPLFKAMTAKFNESGVRGLLLNTLPLDGNLDIISQTFYKEDNKNLFLQKKLLIIKFLKIKRFGKNY